MRLHSYRASGNCLKVRMLLGALDRPYDLVEVDIFGGDTLTDAFGALNPLRETPVLEVDDGGVVTQSNAILSFLAEGTAWAGADRLQRAQALAWLAFEQERVMPGLGAVRFRLQTGRATAEQLADRIALGCGALDVLHARLGEQRWLVGDAPTIADLGLYPYVSAAAGAGLDPAAWPAVERWRADVGSLPGVVDDLVPYPPNAGPGEGRSIYG